jgi:hypothetical protein
MDFMKFMPATAIQAQIADAMMPYYEQEFDDLVGQGADPMGTALYLSKSGTIPGLDLEMGMANGGRVGMANGGLRDSGMVSTSKGYGPAGAGGAAMGPSGNQGGNQGGNKGGKKDSSKEVDIDQLEEKQEPVVTVQPAVKPMLDDLMQQQLLSYAPVEEQSFLDTVGKYNPLAQTFQVTPDLSFSYDVNPNLKDLSDLNATAGLTYSFDKGGSVSGRLSDEGKTLRLSEDDKFIQAENVGDTELYNYLVGGEIMPGLNFEFGLMDDAVMEPGMMSPEDLKFFRLIKDF